MKTLQTLETEAMAARAANMASAAAIKSRQAALSAISNQGRNSRSALSAGERARHIPRCQRSEIISILQELEDETTAEIAHLKKTFAIVTKREDLPEAIQMLPEWIADAEDDHPSLVARKFVGATLEGRIVFNQEFELLCAVDEDEYASFIMRFA